MKFATRFLGTVAGALFALLALGNGIVATSLVNAVIAALVIGVVWTLIRPIGRVFTFVLDMLLLGIPGLLLDAGLLMLITGILNGLYIKNFGWALIAALFVMIGRLLGTGIVKNKNNPEGLSIFGDIHADEDAAAELPEGQDETDAVEDGEEGESADNGEDEAFLDSDDDQEEPLFEMEPGDDEEPEEEGSLPAVEGT